MLPKRQTIAVVLIILSTVTAFFSFASVRAAVLVDGASIFVIPTLWFFVLLTLFSVGTMVWRERTYQIMASVLVVLPSLFFAPSLVHAMVLAVAGLLTFGGLLRIGRELADRVRFSLYRSVFVGLSLVIIALSLAISSQYYAHIQTLPWNRLVPSFDLAEGTGAWMLRVAGTMSPSLATLQNRDLSVDHFLQELRPALEVDGPSDSVRDSISEAVRQAEIMRSKIELSRLLGRDIGGDESMNVILSEVLCKIKIDFVSWDVVLFSFLARTGFITFKKVSVEQEVIV